MVKRNVGNLLRRAVTIQQPVVYTMKKQRNKNKGVELEAAGGI